ncbi:hypothetical protein [Rhizobium bangladeshense]|uniref:hypothetical protein n=1 Tax=Rhizobium bangladeshense TaxID=1138189 RepID=UPI0007E56D01|nr:hypothetical protein [Rhizobium bangladeshense]
MSDENRPLVIVLGFHQTFERVPVKGDELNDNIDARGFKLDDKGKRVLTNVEVDWVTYAPAHSPMGANTTERIRHMKPTQEIMDGENAEKTRFMMARWAAIEPAYEAWKKGHELPINGTPLAHWPGVSAAMAAELRKYNILTVENVRDLGETQLERIRLPNMRDLRNSAKAFLDNLRSAEAAEREVERDNEVAALKEMLAEQNERLAAAMALLEERTQPGGDDEAAALKAKLDAKGVKYHHRAGVETLRALLAEAA